jgi:hypothetical protein
LEWCHCRQQRHPCRHAHSCCCWCLLQREVHGLNVAFLDGSYDAAAYNSSGSSAAGSPHYSRADVEQLKKALQQMEGEVDLLLTCEWPQGLLAGVPKNLMPSGERAVCKRCAGGVREVCRRCGGGRVCAAMEGVWLWWRSRRSRRSRRRKLPDMCCLTCAA